MKQIGEIREAGPISRTFFRVTGFVGVFAPDDRIYIDRKWLRNEGLKRHELMHAEQRRRHGWFGFWWRCLWFIARYGYWNSPFEVEAREAGGQSHERSKRR